MTSQLNHMDRDSSKGTHRNACNTVFILVPTFLKKLKALNSLLTTTAECYFKRFDMQCPHALFKLKCFIFIKI